MRALLLVSVAALSLSGCNGLLSSPAPLSKTSIDDHGLRYAFLTLDTMASLADAGLAAHWLTPGSAKAIAIANGLVAAKNALNAASHAQKAGSTADYFKAFDEATKAMALVKAALGSHSQNLTAPSKSFVSVESTVSRLRA